MTIPEAEAASHLPAVELMSAKAEPTLKNPEAEGFYTEALRELTQLGLPFLLAGVFDPPFFDPPLLRAVAPFMVRSWAFLPSVSA